MEIGARYQGDGKCCFSVWAPFSGDVILVIIRPENRVVHSKKNNQCYWIFEGDDLFPEIKYFYRLEGSLDRSDPASFSQSEGVQGPSQVVDHEYLWHDHSWQGIPLEDMIISELHIGTFTEEGTFEAVIPRLIDLGDLGINSLEIMPVGQFPGTGNWGYDEPFLLRCRTQSPHWWRNAITGQPQKAEGLLYIGDLLQHFPVAFLLGRRENED